MELSLVPSNALSGENILLWELKLVLPTSPHPNTQLCTGH